MVFNLKGIDLFKKNRPLFSYLRIEYINISNKSFFSQNKELGLFSAVYLFNKLTRVIFVREAYKKFIYVSMDKKQIKIKII
jgi:hypothetical protein